MARYAKTNDVVPDSRIPFDQTVSPIYTTQAELRLDGSLIRDLSVNSYQRKVIEEVRAQQGGGGGGGGAEVRRR